MENTNTQLAPRTQMQSTLATIDAKLKTIKAASESPFKTNGEFRFNPQYTANSPINIHKTTDLRLLISILSYLTGQDNNYNKAADLLGLKKYPAFEWCSFGYEAWKHDIEIRVSLVTQREEIEKLKGAKAKLESFLTEEDRLAIVLTELKDLI